MTIVVADVFTDNDEMNAILDGGYHWANDSGRGATRIDYLLTVYPSESPPLARWETNAFLAGMAAWAQVANLDFRQSWNWNVVELAMAAADSKDMPSPSPPGLLAFQEGPYTASHKDDGQVGVGIYFRDMPSWTAAATRPAGYGFLTILHELGHGLGLAHPFDEGQSGESREEGHVEEISTLSTVMAYADWRNDPATGYADLDHVAPMGAASTRDYGHFLTPTARDVAAIQRIYGANPDRDDGDGDGRADDIYRLPRANEPGTGWTTIWDTGGTDWIWQSGARPAHISLEPWRFDRGVTTEGGFSQTRSVRGGLTIADDVTGALTRAQGGFRGVLIENASGGGGSDVIEGNAASNRLFGRAGWDRISGLGGEDEISGGAGGDILLGGTGGDVLRGGTGADTLRGGSGSDRLYGDSGDDLLNGAAGADRFVFRPGGGLDTISDFGRADVIDLRPYDGLSFRQILAESRSFSGGLRLFAGEEEIRLEGVGRADLAREDFLL